jgi:C4-dicarboxylate transporter DctQ subunit
MLKIIKNLDYYIQPVAITILLIAVGIQILYRFLPNFNASWTLELMTYVFSLSIWFGVSIAIKEDAHAGITFFVDKLPLKIKKNITIIRNVLFFLLMIWIGVLATDGLVYYFEKGLKSSAMAAPYYILRLPTVIGCIYSCYRLIQKIIFIYKDPEYFCEKV